MKAELINMWSNLTRVYEIGLLGDFSIRVMFYSDYIEGFKDYETIKENFKGVEFSSDGDLIVEIVKPKDYKPNAMNETLSDILDRVEVAKNNEKPTRFTCTSCDALLNSITDRLNLSYMDREKVIDIAKVIAQLDGSKEIEPVHVAEGGLYVHTNYPHSSEAELINAEGNCISFGHGISISRTTLYRDDITKAIEHLKSLL